MAWRDVMQASFPPPCEGEPSSLRQDILDELSDHLACALDRELRRTDDPGAAEHHVINRFGDPRSIARRLWWDAMKEKIMRDRLFLVVTLLVFVALLAAFIVPWMAQQNRINAAILAKLETLGATNSAGVAENWSKAKIRLVEPGGVPIVGHRVQIKGTAFNEKEIYITQRTDGEGLALFGPVRPGQYSLETGMRGLRLTESIELYPGNILETTITAPGKEAESQVSFRIAQAEELPADILLECNFRSAGGYRAAGSRWETQGFYQIVDARGQVVKSGLSSAAEVHLSLDKGATQPMQRRPVTIMEALAPPVTEPSSAVAAASYSLISVVVWRLERDVAIPPDQLQLRNLRAGEVAAKGLHGSFWVKVGQYQCRDREACQSFSAQSPTSTWTIELPKELVREVNESGPLETRPSQ